MTSFTARLLDQVSRSDSGKLLKDYLSDNVIDGREPRSGRLFEKFQEAENKPFEVTPSDLLSITQLSMRIGGPQSISDVGVVNLFRDENLTAISQHLKKIDPNLTLEKMSLKEFENFRIISIELFELLTQIGFKDVAKYKLLARKRPNVCPIRDKFVRQALGNPKGWYRSWFEAFQPEIGVVAELQTLRKNCPAARHLSLLRVADIIIWERQKQK
jgi:hypothetical protein